MIPPASIRVFSRPPLSRLSRAAATRHLGKEAQRGSRGAATSTVSPSHVAAALQVRQDGPQAGYGIGTVSSSRVAAALQVGQKAGREGRNTGMQAAGLPAGGQVTRGPGVQPARKKGMELRNYQEDCIQAVLRAIRSGHRRMGISLATGSGKTVIFTHLIERVGHPHPDFAAAAQTLILAHRRELVEQAAKHCTMAYPKARVEIEMGSLRATGRADITIASVQSITSRDRLDKYDPLRYKLVMVDEAHHIVSAGYMRTLRHFGLDRKQDRSPILIGVSATFGRFDGLALGAAIDEIVYHKDYVDMIEGKWLSDVLFTTVDSKADMTNVKSGVNGDFSATELSRAVNTHETNQIIVRSWLARAPDRKSTLVFCVDLAHVASLTSAFRERQLDARFISGDTPKAERSATLEAFRNREFPILINCSVFTEGTDIPNIDCVVLARPTRSKNLLIQMIGRGMRLYPGKKDCHIIDVVSSLSTGVVCTPTLYGLDPGLMLGEQTPQDLNALRDRADRQEAEDRRLETAYGGAGQSPTVLDGHAVSVTFTDYASILDLISDTSGEKHIRALSSNAWVRAGPDRYILNGQNGSYLRIEKVQPDGGGGGTESRPAVQFRTLEYRALPAKATARYAAPRVVLEASSFSDAVHGSDSYASQIYIRTYIDRDQPWRKQPASRGQLDFLNKVRANEKPLTTDDVTKGKAADMITKIKHGARGQFAQIGVEQRQKVRRENRVAERKKREQVRVGPLSV